MSKHKEFSGLAAWRERPEGAIQPVKTNWTVVPANDNADPEEIADFSFERHLRVTPSVEEIMKNVATGDVRRSGRMITQIGNLRFSVGNSTERAYTNGPDGKLIPFEARMPAGAMLGTREKAEGLAGGTGMTQALINASNAYFADMFGVQLKAPARRTKRRNGPSITSDEAKLVLAAAIANTPVMPPVTKCPPGLPCASPRLAENFIGMQKTSTASSGGAIRWEDISTSIVNREVWDETLRLITERDVEVLDAAMTASSLADLSPGGHRGSATRRGKRILAAANDNLNSTLQKSAA